MPVTFYYNKTLTLINTINIIYHINILTQEIQYIKCASNEWHNNLTNVNIGIFLKTEDCEGVHLTCRVVLHSSTYSIW
jgi:hypothetical protein